MPARVLTLAVPVPLVAIAALAIGCDGGGDDASATPTVTIEEAAPTTSSAALPTDTIEAPESPGNGAALDITQEDLTIQPGVVAFLAEQGGEVDADAAVYGDLTGDGIDEAVLPISSGGEGGDIGAFVFGYRDGVLDELLRVVPEGNSLVIALEDMSLMVTEPIFAPGDPLCCPSDLRIVTYRWDGDALVVTDEMIVPTGTE